MKFSGCMRSHGVTDFPDPTIGSNGLPSWTLMRAMSAPSHRRSGRLTGSARTTCPDLPETSAEKAAANAAALKYATCMRSHGVPNFPDPNGQGLIQIKNATGSLDASSPQFQKAETACNSLDNGFAEQLGATSASPAPGGAETGS